MTFDGVVREHTVLYSGIYCFYMVARNDIKYCLFLSFHMSHVMPVQQKKTFKTFNRILYIRITTLSR